MDIRVWVEQSQWYPGCGREPFALGDRVNWLLIAQPSYSEDRRLRCGQALRLVRRIAQEHESDIGEYRADSSALVVYGGQPDPPDTIDDTVLVEEHLGRFVEATDPPKTSAQVTEIWEAAGAFADGAADRTLAVIENTRAIDHVDLELAGSSGSRVIGWLVGLEVTAGQAG